MEKLKAPLKQWIKFALMAITIILFSIWLGNYWVLLLLPFAFDIYISRFINWGWWRNIKNNTIRKVFEWADAIIFALVAVYFINLYLFQNYKIPSSSLEKTLLVGDHLFVSKVAYGPRTPNTPFSFPLVQHTFPIVNSKSYIEGIQWESRRLAGFGNVQRNDIVVFNFPAGDTVATKQQAVDYESLCYSEGLDMLQAKGMNPFILQESGVNVRSLCLKLGRESLHSKHSAFGEIVYRPVDRRENYVKRCVGLPGDTLEIREREIYIDGEKQERQPGVQYYCKVLTSQLFTEDNYDKLQVSKENTKDALKGVNMDGYNVYFMPLTQENQESLKKLPFVISVSEESLDNYIIEQTTYPVGYNLRWTVDNYGPIWIPKAGTTIDINVENLPIYERVIRNYEGNKLDVKGSDIYINNEKATQYTFAMNYYWMMGDNRHNSADSRTWGFVPENHVVGKPIFIWLSLNPDKGWLNGKIRWERFFKYAGE